MLPSIAPPPYCLHLGAASAPCQCTTRRSPPLAPMSPPPWHRLLPGVALPWCCLCSPMQHHPVPCLAPKPALESPPPCCRLCSLALNSHLHPGVVSASLPAGSPPPHYHVTPSHGLCATWAPVHMHWPTCQFFLFFKIYHHILATNFNHQSTPPSLVMNHYLSLTFYDNTCHCNMAPKF